VGLPSSETSLCTVTARPNNVNVYKPTVYTENSILYDSKGKKIEDYHSLRYENVLYLLADFNEDNRVDSDDLALFVTHFGKDESGESWDEKFDIGPRNNFSVDPYYPGELIVQETRVIDIYDLVILTNLYNYMLEDGELIKIE
jgi:hypothetical protein